MKKLATAVVAIALIGTPALAADIAVKAAAPSPPAGYNWTGWYAGVNAGASFGNVKTDFNGAPITNFAVPLLVTQSPIPGFSGGSDREYPSGFIGGGQIGYNWQFSPIWVAGFEADFQGALERDSGNVNNPFTANVPIMVAGVGVTGTQTYTGTAVADYTTKIEWFGTVRLRAGYVWGNGDVFSYVTGGLAYGKVDLEGTSTLSAQPFGISVTNIFSHNAVNTGWVAGYGTEGRLTGMPGWTWKVEGLYMDLGTLDTAGIASGATGNSLGRVTGGEVTTHSRFTDGILRGGLNYKFN